MDFSANLMAIQRANPGVRLSDQDQKAALTGQLVQVGVGSVLTPGSLVANPRPTPPDFQSRGCIDYLQFFEDSEDLQWIIVDGNIYGGTGTNLKQFQHVLLEAALAMKCVSFCWYPEDNRMTMLNVHPQCCCRCESHG